MFFYHTVLGCGTVDWFDEFRIGIILFATSAARIARAILPGATSTKHDITVLPILTGALITKLHII